MDDCQVELVILLGFLSHVEFSRCLGEIEDCFNILVIEGGRIFEAVVGSLVVASLQIEFPDADVLGRTFGIVDVGSAIGRLELELFAVGIVQAKFVGVVEAGAALCLFLCWSGVGWVRRIGG